MPFVRKTAVYKDFTVGPTMHFANDDLKSLCLCAIAVPLCSFLSFPFVCGCWFLNIEVVLLGRFPRRFFYIKYCLRLCLCALRKKGYISISKCATVHFANDQNRGAVAATEASTPGVYVYHYIHIHMYIYWIHVYAYIPIRPA